MAVDIVAAAAIWMASTTGQFGSPFTASSLVAPRVETLGTCASPNFGALVILDPVGPSFFGMHECGIFGWQPMTNIQGFTWVAVPHNNQGVATGTPFFRTPGSFCGIPLTFNFTVTSGAVCTGACALLPVESRNSVIAVLNGSTEVCTIAVPCATTQGSAVSGSCTGASLDPLSDTTILFRASGTTCTENPAGQGTGAVAITACPGQ